jgi:glycosyltransferase involved in cell wall biosynthesis
MAKLIFATYQPPPPLYFAGTEVNQRIFCKQVVQFIPDLVCISAYNTMKDLAYFVRELTILGIKVSKLDTDTISYHFDNYQCIFTTSVKLTYYIDLFAESATRIITQQAKAHHIINHCLQRNYLVCFWLHHTPTTFDNYNLIHADYVFVASNFLKNKLFSYRQKQVEVFYPSFEDCDIDCQHRKYITLVNPIADKGLEIVEKVASLFPEEQFLLVGGWSDLDLPEHYASNIQFEKRTYHMAEIYAKTKVLLAPSKLEEGFGRTIIEAGIYGIPSLVSHRGALPEALGEGGIVVANDEIQNWKTALNDVLKNYTFFSNMSKLNADRYVSINAYDRLKEMGLYE